MPLLVSAPHLARPPPSARGKAEIQRHRCSAACASVAPLSPFSMLLQQRPFVFSVFSVFSVFGGLYDYDPRSPIP